jgi:hypothetical protein
MRDFWYSDNRDLLKWALLIHLADKHKLKTIIQVPFWRRENKQMYFTLRDKRIPIPDEVWSFFRDIRHIKQLGSKCGITLKVVGEEFTHPERLKYSTLVVQYLKGCKGSLLLFLDPDTGLEPQKPNEKHVSLKELQNAWANLHVGDFMVLYQHARREKNWCKNVKDQVSKACGVDVDNVDVAYSEDIGRNVAFFCIEKHTR